MDRDEQLQALVDISETAAASATDLDAAVEHCPEWTVGDLVVHLADVQWFWANVVGERTTNGDDVVRPSGPPDGVGPVEYLRTQSDRLVEALAAADDDTPVWTWFADQQHVGFVLRRQVLEAAVHCWDIEHAVGEADDIEPDVATLGLEEFVEVMAQDVHADRSPAAALSLEPEDAEWRGTLFGETNPIIALSADASDLLLLLWGRNETPDQRITQTLACINLN